MKKVGKIILAWISVLCLSTIVLLVQSVYNGYTIELYFTTGYAVAALICVMMFCTIISICINTNESKVEDEQRIVTKLLQKPEIEFVHEEEPIESIIAEPVSDSVGEELRQGLHDALSSD